MNDECKKTEFTDQELDEHISLNQALVFKRDGDDNHAIVRTNVPHLVVHHSPSGFEWGYSGSGPADLALNVCQWYLLHIDYKGAKSQCWDGNCYSLAYALHQDFKQAFIANAPRAGITIPLVEVKKWFEEHITEDLKRMYALVEEE